MGLRLDQTLAILNGWLGDYLARKHNGLVTEMTFRRDGASLALERASLATAYPQARSRVVVLVHGLMCTEDNWTMPDGSDYGRLLERDFGYSALYLRYNTGLSIADNGARFAAMLERLLAAFPVEIEELLLIGYSMGGLLVRSACHVAAIEEQRWLSRVGRIIYIGTPHLGTPGERVGKLVAGVLQRIPNPTTQLIADIGNLRSDGVKDLGHADLRTQDRVQNRGLWALSSAEHPVPLLPGIAHYLIAGTLFADPRLALLFGDSVVPLASATFEQADADALIPPQRVRKLRDINHVALAHHPAVYRELRSIIEAES